MKWKWLLILISVILFGCDIGYIMYPIGNERTSDSAIFEDFEKYEKELDIKFSVEQLSKEYYSEHFKGGKELISNLKEDSDDYFKEGIDKDIRLLPSKFRPNDFIDYYDFHTINTGLSDYEYKEYYKVSKPNDWNEIKDHREKVAPVYYIKSLDKIKTLRYDYNMENIDMGRFDDVEILIQGIKDGEIKILVAVKYRLVRIPIREDFPDRAKRIKIYELTLDLYEDTVEMRPYWEYTWNEYKEKEHKKYYYR